MDLGFVGEPEKVNPEVLRMITRSDLIPVVAPIGVGRKGETFNINADTVAGAVAGAMGRRAFCCSPMSKACSTATAS